MIDHGFYTARIISLKKFKVVKSMDFSEQDYLSNVIWRKFKDSGQHAKIKTNQDFHFINTPQFNYLWILSRMLPNYTIIDCQTKYTETGHPDFIAVKNNLKDPYKDVLYIEFKSLNDGLRPEQINWFLKNPEKRRYILSITNKTVSEDDPFKDLDVVPSFVDKFIEDHKKQQSLENIKQLERIKGISKDL